MYLVDELELMFGNVACEIQSICTDIAYTWNAFVGTLDKRKQQLRKERAKLAKRQAKLMARKAKAARCKDKAKRETMQEKMWCEEQEIRERKKVLGGKR